MDKRIVVSAKAGVIDSVQVVLRSLVIVATAVPILLTFVGKHDLIGMIAYLQSVDGAQTIAALTGIASMVYGIYKAHKRGTQIATVAGSNLVPDTVAVTKDKVL